MHLCTCVGCRTRCTVRCTDPAPTWLFSCCAPSAPEFVNRGGGSAYKYENCLKSTEPRFARVHGCTGGESATKSGVFVGTRAPRAGAPLRCTLCDLHNRTLATSLKRGHTDRMDKRHQQVMYSRAMASGDDALTSRNFPTRVEPFCQQFADEVILSAVTVLRSIHAWNDGVFTPPFRAKMRVALHAAIDRHIPD